MKKLIAFIVVAIILILTVIVEQIYLSNSFELLIQKIDNLNQQVSITETINTEQIKSSANDLENYWNSIENVLCMTINYNDLHRVGEQLQRVKSYIEQDKKEDCVPELEVLKFYAEKYKMIFLINFSNVF